MAVACVLGDGRRPATSQLDAEPDVDRVRLDSPRVSYQSPNRLEHWREEGLERTERPVAAAKGDEIVGGRLDLDLDIIAQRGEISDEITF